MYAGVRFMSFMGIRYKKEARHNRIPTTSKTFAKFIETEISFIVIVARENVGINK